MAEVKIETAPKAKKATAASKAGETTVKVAAKKAPAVKSAAKAVVAPKAVAPKVAAEKKAAVSTKSKAAKISVTLEQRYQMICDAAYFKAQHRGFSPKNEIQDWLDAEAEINHLLGM